MKPVGLAIDDQGNIYTADWSQHSIRKVTPDGVIGTVEVNGNIGDPFDIALDPMGNFFLALQHRILKVAGDSAPAVTSCFPQVAVGGGWSTLFTFINTGVAEAFGNLIRKDSQGNPLMVNGELTGSSGMINPASTGLLQVRG